MAASGGAAGEECVVELVVEKTEAGARWVVVKSKAEVARERQDESQDRDIPEDRGQAVAWICAEVDLNEKWWDRLRGNPKRAGEISQAAFLLKAEMLGFDLALPWGDNQKFDFVVWRRNGRAFRVQVKGTGRLHRRGYEVKPVRSARGGGKKRYTKKDIDVIAAHVQPVDAWYLIPIEKVGRAKSLRLYPGIESRVKGRTVRKSRRVGHPGKLGTAASTGRSRMWETWRDRWDVLE